jgi:deoxycytidine triphosphate deaminase
VILTDADIRARLSDSSTSGFNEAEDSGQWLKAAETLLIYPFDPAMLTPLGYDLRVGEQHMSLKRKKEFKLKPGGDLTLEPGETMLISTEEYVGLPKEQTTLAALIESKVSLVSLGLSPVSTTIDPDWEGHLLVALTNYQSYPITLLRGQPFCTVIFLEVKTRATKRVGRPPGRTDIILEWLRGWKKAAEDAQKSRLRRSIPVLLFVLVVLVLSAGAFYVLGSSEGFSGWVAVTVALATLVFSEIRRNR